MRRVAVLLSLTLLVAACRGPAPSADTASGDAAVVLDITLSDTPTVGSAEIVVHVSEGGDAVAAAEVEVTGDMTHAGMVPVVATATETEPGRYATEDFAFSMAGDWILTVEATLHDGRTVSSEASTTVAAP